MKTTRILAISVLVLVVGLPAGVEAKYMEMDGAGAKWLDVRYDDDAYFVIDCYLDGNGNTWLLLWDWLDGRVLWIGPDYIGHAGDCFLNINGVPGESVGGGGGVPTVSVGGGGGVPTESVGGGGGVPTPPRQ